MLARIAVPLKSTGRLSLARDKTWIRPVEKHCIRDVATGEREVVYLSFVDLYYCVRFAVELVYNCVQKTSCW